MTGQVHHHNNTVKPPPAWNAVNYGFVLILVVCELGALLVIFPKRSLSWFRSLIEMFPHQAVEAMLWIGLGFGPICLCLCPALLISFTKKFERGRSRLAFLIFNTTGAVAGLVSIFLWFVANALGQAG